MTTTPRVSVGVPVYNGARWLPPTLDSILSQTFKDIEVVICDNASTDDTEAVCREYMTRDPRVRYFRNGKNLGVFNNFNAAFRNARGEYFRWNACADLCDRRLIEAAVELLDAHPDAVLVYPKARIFENEINDGYEYQNPLDARSASPVDRARNVLERSGLNITQFGLIRSRSLARTMLNPSHLAGDMVLMLELSLLGKFLEIPEILFYLRERPETATKFQDYRSIMRYIDPESGSPRLQTWKIFRSRFAAVAKTRELTIAERFILYRSLLRYMAWERTSLRQELVASFFGA